MQNIRIKEVSFYHPENLVKNDYYIEHFKKQGKDITNLLEAMEKKERYIIDNEDENTLTMGIEASKRVLEKAGLEGNDIDMIVFSTQVPEQNLPTNAIFVHQAIGGKQRTILMDSNANCAGMTVAVENASRYLLSNPHVKNALVIGSDANSLITNPDQEITYAIFSDGACAVILEKTEEDTGFIDSIFEVDSTHKDNIIYPPKGFSKGLGKREYINFIPFDVTWIPEFTQMIEELLSRNDLAIGDIDAFCFSQFAMNTNRKLQKMLGIPEEKFIHVGDKYGYTSTSSPFVCLHEAVKDGRIKRGDTILFWTIGSGHEMIAMLYKY